MKNVVVLNDEAHHCYREKPDQTTTRTSRATRSEEAKKNNEAARLWISGLEAVKRKLGLARGLRPLGHAVLPARLRLRRGHALPVDGERLLADGRDRVRHRQAAARAVADNIPGDEMPMFRNLWEHIGKDMPKKGRGNGEDARPAEAADRAADGARGALRPLREDVRRSGSERGHRRAARASSSSATTRPSRSSSTTTSPASTARHEDGTTVARARPARAVPQLRRARQPARAARTRS